MTEEYTPQPEPASEPANEPVIEPAGDAWRDVMAQLEDLGEAIGRWARAAAGDPAYSERAAEIKAHVDKLAASVTVVVDDAAKTDVGQQVVDAANKTGEALKAAGERISDEAAPRIASGFRFAAEKLHQAAERIGSTPDDAAEEPPADDPAPGDV